MSRALLHSVSIAMKKAEDDSPPPLDVRGLARKTLLLILGVVLAGVATTAVSGEPDHALRVVILLGIVCLFILSATFAIAGFVQLFRMFGRLAARTRHRRLRAQASAGVADPWLDAMS